MKYCTSVYQCWQTTRSIIFSIANVVLFATLIQNASAITAQEIVDNVLEVYEDIEDYAAVVQTYETDSMDASGSIFEVQPPKVTFNLFFRHPDEHAVEEISNAGRGIFRIELLSALGHLKHLEMHLQGKAFLLGKACHLIEFIDPHKPGDKAYLWVSAKDWKVLQLTLFMKSIELVRTQFRYTLGNRGRSLPFETRTFFPVSKRVFINRIMDYKINTGLPTEIFDTPDRR